MSHTVKFLVGAAIWLGLVSLGWAQEVPAAQEPAAEANTATEKPATEQPAEVSDEIAAWIKELDSERFDSRQKATDALIKAGKPTIEPLTKAAEGDSLETTTRAIEILKQLFKTGDAETKGAAKAALEALSKSANKSAARRASMALAPLPDPNAIPPGIRPGVQIAGGGNNIRVQAKNMNGVKEISIDENGKKILIEESNEKGISVKITEKVNGQDKTETFKAKDAEELKKKHPAASAYYEKYNKGGVAGGGGIFQIQIGGLPGGIPGIPGFPMGPAAINKKKLIDDLSAAQADLDYAIEQLKKQTEGGNPNAEEIAKLADKIAEAKKKIDGVKEKLEK